MKPIRFLLGVIFALFMIMALSPAVPFPTAQATNHVPDGLTPADWAQIQSQLAPKEITTYNQQAKLTASEAAVNDEFGSSVDVSGDTVVIGARGDDDAGDNSGSAYVFTHTTGVCSQQAKLTASDGSVSDFFGNSVAVSGDKAVIGAHGDNDGGSDSGSVYVFTRTAGVWSQQAKLTAKDSAAFDRFGYSVAISGNTAVIGAYQDDDRGIQSGSVYTYAFTSNPSLLQNLPVVHHTRWRLTTIFTNYGA